MTMNMLDEGGEFIVVRVRLNRETGKRLADMGFTEGAKGCVIRRGFFYGPLQISLGESDVMIRAEEAAGIDVEPVGDVRLYGRVQGGRGPGRGLGRGPGRGKGKGMGRGAWHRDA